MTSSVMKVRKREVQYSPTGEVNSGRSGRRACAGPVHSTTIALTHSVVDSCSVIGDAITYSTEVFDISEDLV